tara:strand:+ start:1198 stop:1875 length:678 start_codon:yes stop_codon:yes gene_type:complete
MALSCEVLLAQKSKPLNLPNFDRKRIHFGFTLGINSMDFKMDQDLRKVDSLTALKTDSQSGFHIGIISALHFNKYFSLRFLPTLAFGQRNLEYTFEGNEGRSVVIKQVESTLIEFPFNVKYRSARYNNFAMYLVAGAKYSLDLASDKSTDNDVPELEQLVRLQQNSYSWEVGFGFDFFLEYFKFSPELKYSRGFDNVLIKENTIWSSPINKLQPAMIMINFNFEG